MKTRAREEFDSWLQATAVSVCKDNRAVVRPQPLFDKLCGAIQAMHRLEAHLKPTNHIYTRIFRDVRNGEPTKEIEQEAQASLNEFFSRIYQKLIPRYRIPFSESKLLDCLLTDLMKKYFPAWFNRWGAEESNFLEVAIQLLDEEARLTIEDFYFPDANPPYTEAEIVEAGGATRAEIAEMVVPTALTALAATAEFRTICQRLGLFIQSETKSP